jgi:hypothetical protein
MGRVTNTESFIREATLINGDRYDYSLVKYTRSVDKVEIICKKHGIFWQEAEKHLCGKGCPICRKRSKGAVNRGLIINREVESLTSDKRKCSKCGECFDRDFFHPDKEVADGLSSQCKKCANEATEDWKSRNIEPVMEWRKAYGKRKWAEFKEEHKEEFEERAEKKRLLIIENKRRDKTTRTLRHQLKDAVKSGYAKPHLLDLLGCTIDEFHAYIESLWTEGMSWDNCGYWGWHFDHIVPCASFNRDNLDDIKKCFHYTNYQPLWREDNLSKGAKYNGIDYRKHNR